jgi:serine acetyltransferase
MACLLWSYAGSIRALLNDEHVTAAKLIASQSRFWNRARVAAGCSILAGVVIAFCF